MKENLLHDWEKRFRRYIVYSLLAHVALLLFFTVKAFLFEVPEVDFSSAVLVELVALPDKVSEEIPAAAATPEPTPTTTPTPVTLPKTEEKVVVPEPKPLPPVQKKVDDAINLDKVRKKQSDAMKRLQQQEALEKLQKEMEQESRTQAVQNVKQKFKGNVISPGTSLTGTQKFVQQAYTAEIDRLFRSNWALPQYLRGQDLSADVNVKFDERGNVIAADLVKSSGNGVFDDMVMAAVNKSSPVPEPPDQFVQIAKTIGFLFRFRE